MSSDIFNSSEGGQEQTQWMPVSDLMAGLMMVFLFISVSMMRYALVEARQDKGRCSYLSGDSASDLQRPGGGILG